MPNLTQNKRADFEHFALITGFWLFFTFDEISEICPSILNEIRHQKWIISHKKLKTLNFRPNTLVETSGTFRGTKQTSLFHNSHIWKKFTFCIIEWFPSWASDLDSSVSVPKIVRFVGTSCFEYQASNRKTSTGFSVPNYLKLSKKTIRTGRIDVCGQVRTIQWKHDLEFANSRMDFSI